MGRSGNPRLFTSPPLLAELSGILSRPKFEKKIIASQLSLGELIDLYTALVLVVRPASVPRTAPDPDDDVVIGTALAAKAHFLVTGDQTLLSLAKYDGGKIVSVRDALQAVVAG
jgi:putative PIN family toxin of toxin-antitoxin system